MKKNTTNNKYVPKKTVLKVLRNLKETYGIVRPEDLIAYAEPEDSPVHNLFEWDNDIAAHQYRLWQARQIITRVKVNIGGVEVQAFHNIIVRTSEGRKQGYFEMDTILSEKQMYTQLLKTALEELKYWQTKYESLKELKPISKKITKFFEDLDKSETEE